MSLNNDINNNIRNIDFVNQEFDHTVQIQNPMSLLPNEIVLEIFSYLNVAILGRICLVSKQWKQLISHYNLLKKAVYKEMAFGNDKWAKYFGKDVVKDEDNREEFSSLPLNEYIEDCKKFKSIFPEKNAKDILLLVRIPKTLNGGLTLKSLGELAKKYFSDNVYGYGYISSSVENSLGDKTIPKSYWVIMTKELLPESISKNLAEQKEIIANLAQKALIGYEIPETLEATTCILSQYFDSNIRLFNYEFSSWNYYTRCKEEFHGYPVSVGGFSRWGLRIERYYTIDGELDEGVAALRKF